VVLTDPTLILAATNLEEEHDLSFWDALVVEAARVAGAERLLTEDLQHDRVIAGVRIDNPFVRTGDPAARSQPGTEEDSSRHADT
jgi:predicted nucleic acid-binding protein